MNTGKKGGNRYDAELIDADAVAICDHYLNERRREGRRYVYRCPDCGKPDFEVEPVKGMAGCFNPACSMPKTTNALGIISHMEGLERRGADFVRCLEKGYEILGLATPADVGREQGGGEKNGERSSSREDDASTASDRNGSSDGHLSRADGPDGEDLREDLRRPQGRQWVRQNGADGTPEARVSPRVYPVEAYFEGPNGEEIPTEAVIVEEYDEILELTGESLGPPAPVEELQQPVDYTALLGEPPVGPRQAPDPDPEETGSSGRRRSSRLFDRPGQQASAWASPDERALRHAVYERLLALCPLEKRDAAFFEGRGLDRWTITQGRFGSISTKRSRWVAEKLREHFGDEDLLRVPGFYRPEVGPVDDPQREPKRIRFSLYGDYALIPYHDADGYITTVEGRLIGEPKNKRDKKYKALLGSGVHLYVHPRFGPGKVLAFCEGAIAAMVAARYGVPVAAIKGFRNYKVSGRERGDEDRVLPELEGTDFAGRTVVYIPDVDVKPASREEVMEAVPAACEWLISRQGGVPKVALLPEGAKDLDEWLLSLPESERTARAGELLAGAVDLGEWTGHREGFPKEDRDPGDAPPAADEIPEAPAANAAQPAGGKRDLLGDDATPAGGPFPGAGRPVTPEQGRPESGAAATRELGWDTGPVGPDGAGRPGGASDGSAPAAHDAERARKGRMHPAMARWYEVARYTPEQVASARQQTTVRKIAGKRRPPVRDTPVTLPRWTPGEVVLAVAVALATAVGLCLLAYAMRAGGGVLGVAGALITWPFWWLEAALYAWAGALAATWMVGRRHRARGRQLAAHLRGEK